MKFDVILADPPWFYNQRPTHQKSKTKFGGGASGTYNLMKDCDIIELGPKIKQITSENAALFLWTVEPKQFDVHDYEVDSEMFEGYKSSIDGMSLYYDLMTEWGFRPITTAFTWVKTNQDGTAATGPGYYTSSNIERVLLGIKGKMPPDRKLINQVILEKRMEHSKKPEEIQNRIELMYQNRKYLELFARRKRSGWACCGNELSGLDIRQELDLLNEVDDINPEEYYSIIKSIR